MPKFLLPIFIFLLLSISWVTPIFAQNDSYELMEMITTDDGLAHNYVSCLQKYEISLLVVGSQNGLQVFDGYDFQLFNAESPPPFTMNDSKINSMEIGRDGFFWIGSTNGINKVNPFNGTNEMFLNKGNSKFPPLKTESTSNTFLTSSTDGKIWIVNNGIICQLIDDKVHQYFPERFNDVIQIIGDGDNNIYALTEQSLIGLSMTGDLLFEIKEFHSPLFGKQTRENISHLFKTQKGEVILEDFSNSRFFKINSVGQIEDITEENHWIPKFFKELQEQAKALNIKTLRIFDFRETNHNLIWAATNFGLAKVIIKEEYFETIPELDGVSIRKMVTGEDGLIYGGTFSPQQFFIYNPKNKKIQWVEKNEDVREMIPLNKDSLLILADGGKVRIFSKSQKKVLKEKQTPKKSFLKTVLKDNENVIWFAGEKNFFQSSSTAPLNLKAVQLSEGDPVSKNLVREICPYSDSTFLLATDNGVINYHKEKGEIAIYNTSSDKPQKLLHDVIGQFILDKKGNVWIATDGGLNYFDLKNEQVLKKYSTVNGLANNIIYSMVMENDSILWIGTADGLSKFDIQKEIFTNFYKKDGLADNEFNSNSFAKTKDGKIYMGGIKGVTIIDSLPFSSQKKTFNHFVSSYRKYNGSTGKLTSFFLNPNKVEPIHLRSEELYLEIYFVNSDYTNPRKNTFSYYLEGFEKGWLPKSNKSSVGYSNLPAGEYTFKLRSTNANGVENNSAFEIPIIVHQAFYKSWWFLMLGGVSVLLAFTLFNRYKLREERKITQLRYRMASDLHDEVSNSLNNIRIIAKETKTFDEEKVKEDFSRIQKMSNEAIDHVQDVIWSIDKKYSTTEDLYFKMEDYLDDVIRAKDIPVQFKWEGLDKSKELGFLFRRNMLLIFKEAISNIVKHTKPTRVDILYNKSKEGYFMSIVNKFEERIQSEHSTGKGLIGMQQRAEAMGATMRFVKEDNRFEVIMEKKFKK